MEFMVVRMRHTRSHTANRRSHHAIKAPVLTLCKECGSPKAPHVACQICGKYKDRQVLDVHAKIARQEKRKKAKTGESR